jgi:hypothetical protein
MEFGATIALSSALAVLLAAGGAAGAAAAPAKPAVRVVAASSPQGRQQCDRIAAALSPDSAVPGQTEKLLAALLTSLQKDEAGFGRLEADFPGIANAVADRVRPLMVRNSLAVLPMYRADISRLYCSKMTLGEARSAADFLTSADGVAMVAASQGSVDYNRAAGALAQERDASLSDLAADKRRAGIRAAAVLDAGQKARIGAFFQTAAGRQIIALGPQRSVIDQKWFNYSPPGAEKEVEIATIEAILEHIGKTDPATAKQMREAMVAQGALPGP